MLGVGENALLQLLSSMLRWRILDKYESWCVVLIKRAIEVFGDTCLKNVDLLFIRAKILLI